MLALNVINDYLYFEGQKDLSPERTLIPLLWSKRRSCLLPLFFNLPFLCLLVAEVLVGTYSQRSWTSATSTENTSEEYQSTCPTSTEKGAFCFSLNCFNRLILCVVSDEAHLASPVIPDGYFLSFRMNKNQFEEDDGIDMNDIERFLPHLRTVSDWFSLLFFTENASI